MPRHLTFGVLGLLVLLLFILSNLMNAGQAASPTQSASPTLDTARATTGKPAPPGTPRADGNYTPADIAEYTRIVKTQNLYWQRKRYAEAKKRGLPFVKDGTPFAVPTDTYMLGDWYVHRKDGTTGATSIQKKYEQMDRPAAR